VKWLIRTVPGLQKQLQTAINLSVTFIWSYPWVGFNGLWLCIGTTSADFHSAGIKPDWKEMLHEKATKAWSDLLAAFFQEARRNTVRSLAFVTSRFTRWLETSSSRLIHEVASRFLIEK
jgi:hypothetical protein